MVRKAKLSDARSIYTLVAEFAHRGILLPRSLNSIYEHIRDFGGSRRDKEPRC